jgi:hypothetical protein
VGFAFFCWPILARLCGTKCEGDALTGQKLAKGLADVPNPPIFLI